jgi:hypothetical protein
MLWEGWTGLLQQVWAKMNFRPKINWRERDFGLQTSVWTWDKGFWIQIRRFKLFQISFWKKTKEVKIKPRFGDFSKIEILEFGSNIWNLN